MRAWEIQGSFGVASLRLTERPEPLPGPGEVRVALRAASLNYRDYLMVEGRYNPRQKLPLIPLSDGAGVVVERGAGAGRWPVGARVMPAFATAWRSGVISREKFRSSLGGPKDGTLCEALVVPEEALVEIPPHLSFEQAATFPCAGVTAWSALVRQGEVKPGETVVIQGTGGVALFGLQIARAAGARVLITSSSDEKLARAKAMGAHAGINYRSEPEWGARVRELTDQRGADHVLEVGGAGSLEQSIRAVRMGGTISLIGMLTGGAGAVNLVPVLMQNIRIQGVTVGHAEDLEGLARTYACHRLEPVVDRVFPFEEAPRALEHLAKGAHFGKVCIRIVA